MTTPHDHSPSLQHPKTSYTGWSPATAPPAARAEADMKISSTFGAASAWLLAVVISTLCSPADAQERDLPQLVRGAGNGVTETARGEPGSAIANHRYGESVAISSTDSLNLPETYMVGAPGTGGAGYSLARSVDGTTFTERRSRTWSSPYSPVAASSTLGVFAHEPSASDGRVHLFHPTFEPLIDLLPETPEALGFRPNRLVIGGSDWAGDSGRVDSYFFDSLLDNWEPLQPLFPSDFFCNFGTSVALHNDGNLLAVGAPDCGQNGEVFVFFRKNLEWLPLQTLEPPAEWDSQGDSRFGESVAFEGDWIAVGAPLYNRPLPLGGAIVDAGAVVVFGPSTFIGFEIQYVAWATTSGARLGESVAIDITDTDRGVVVGGAPGGNGAAVGSGFVQLYENSGSGWSPTLRLQASDGSAGDDFGAAVSVFKDNVFVGAPGVDRGGTVQISNVGAVYYFEQLIGEIFTDSFEVGDTSAWN